MNLSNNKILITGGGSGIGLGLAERFVQEGNTVIICGRRQDVLENVAQNIPGIIIYNCDLSDEKQRIDLFEWIKAEHNDLNMLINNAGIQQWTNIDDEDFYSRIKQEIMINVETPVHLTSLFIKLKNLKTIMNVTSGLSFCPLTKVAVYSATKAFFHSFTLSMQHELLKKNIEVIELIPPALNTDLGGKGLHDYAPPVHEFIESIFNQLKAGNTTLTFGMSEGLSKAGPEQLKMIFERMNTA
ncbi:MAG: SDR family NAD(P)-dependent oxidoreductase [Sphingobacteriales bacterium]|nr:SDR family NAD(P)-dependent oxidoreductase [Sphingobacteriales bacterium]